MRRWLGTLLLAVGIPVIAALVIVASDANLERQWREGLESQYGPIPTDAVDRVRLVALCADPQVAGELGTLCTDSRLASVGRTLAVGAVAVSLGLLAFIAATHLATKRDRRSIVRIFRPGLYVVLVALAVLMLLDGAIVVIAAYLGEGALLGAVHPVIIFGVALAVLVAAWGVLGAVVTMGRRRPLEILAMKLDPEEDRAFFALVDHVAQDIGTAGPDQIVGGLEPNFFVTEEDVKSDDGVHHGRTLFVSVAACRILDREELTAVIGHELAHFKGEDTAYSRRFYPIYRGATQSLGILQASARGFAMVPLAAPLMILARYFESFASVERQMSRERELAADAVGAALTSPETAAIALIKLHTVIGDWTAVTQATIASIQGGRPVDNVSTYFAQRAADKTPAGSPKSLLENRTPHPFDSHPPLDDRLKALGVSLDSVADRAAELAPKDAAAALIDHVEELELDLSEAFTVQIAQAMGLEPTLAADYAASRRATLDAAAPGDELIARTLMLFEASRGLGLIRPSEPDAEWVTLVDLEYAVHPDPQPYWPFASSEGANISVHDQHLVLRVADAATHSNSRIAAGTRLKPLGMNGAEWRRAEMAEDVYDSPIGVLTVRDVGDWPLEQQFAGLFVVPASDPAAGRTGATADAIRRIGADLMARPRPAVTAAS